MTFQARGDHPQGDETLPRLARHVDADGRRITVAEAAVELLDLLRPIVAVSRYIVFAAHALHVHRDAIAHLPQGPGHNRAIAEEVRRFYPLFPVIGGRVLEPLDGRGARFGWGEWLLLDLQGNNRDPRVRQAPEQVRPERHLDAAPDAFAMIPQGGGDHQRTHRGPGEWLTTALLIEAVGQLSAMGYTVPEQDLRIPTDRFPPWPRDGMRIAVAG